jgi:Tol biopolymer transport system component
LLVAAVIAAAVATPASGHPDRGRSVVSANLIDCACYDIFRVRPDGTHRVLLSSGGSRDLEDVSGDLSRILFQHYVGVLETSTITGAAKRKLAGSLGSPTGGGRFSPDGTEVAYTLTTAACRGATSVHIVRVDGANDRTAVPECAAPGDLAWSPDGRQLAYVRISSGQDRRLPSQLVVVDLADGVERVLARAPGPIDYLRWSPTGDRIAYVAGGRSLMLHLVRADGSKDIAIASGTAPTWSPDGRLLEYSWTRGNRNPVRIAVIARNGTHNHVLDLRAEDGYGQGVGWSPDGRRIVYRVGVKLAKGYTMALWTARPDGTDRRHVLTGVLNEEFGPLYWTPGGRNIVYTRYIQWGE